MLINANCTVYEKDTYTKHTINDIYWNDSRGVSVQKSGVQTTDSVVVYVYAADYIPKAGDILVKGTIEFSFTTTTQQTISASMKTFRETYPQYAVVKSVNDCRFGGLPHVEVIAR